VLLQEKENAEAWSGVLPTQAKILIHEFEEQHRIVPLTAAIVRWEVYAALHVQVLYSYKFFFSLEELNQPI